MSKEQLYIFDTTLRDGAQTQGVDFSIDDKQKISVALGGVAQPGSASGLGPEGRRFKSCRPDHFKKYEKS